MESDTLPYTLFLILAELAFGGLIAVQAVDMRGHASDGFVRATAIMMPPLLGLALWAAVALDGDVVEGFQLDTGPRPAIVGLLIALTVGSVLHNLAIYTGRHRTGRALGGVLSVLAVVVLLLAAIMLRLPAWSMGLVFFSLLFGTLAIGLAAVGLALGHWYLVSPRLSARPLVEVTLALMLVLLVQWLLLALALALPVDSTPIGGRDRALTADVTFWLRILVGLGLPLAFAWMAWAAARIRGMMSATGLLYLATALILAGEIGARALFFDSARPI